MKDIEYTLVGVGDVGKFIEALVKNGGKIVSTRYDGRDNVGIPTIKVGWRGSPDAPFGDPDASEESAEGQILRIAAEGTDEDKAYLDQREAVQRQYVKGWLDLVNFQSGEVKK